VRRLDSCINCGDEREIAAHGLCFKCYRAEERARKATPDPVWASLGNGWLLREQKRALTVVTGILKAIADCPAVEESDRKQIQNILRPYLDKLAECFAPKREKGKPVNGEQKFERSLVNGRLVRLEEGELSNFVASNKTAGNGVSNQIQSGEQQ
jgi:hypothetical protein